MPSLWTKIHDLFSSHPYVHPANIPGFVPPRKHPHRSKKNGFSSGTLDKEKGLKRRDEVHQRPRRTNEKKHQGLNRSDAHKRPHRSVGKKDRENEIIGISLPSSAHLAPPTSVSHRSDVHRFRQDDNPAGWSNDPSDMRHLSQEVNDVSRHRVNVTDDVNNHVSRHAVMSGIAPAVDAVAGKSSYELRKKAGENSAQLCPAGTFCQACGKRYALPEVSFQEINLALCSGCADDERRNRHRRRDHRGDSTRHCDRSRADRGDDRSKQSSQSSRPAHYESDRKEKTRAQKEPRTDNQHRQPTSEQRERKTESRKSYCGVCGVPVISTTAKNIYRLKSQICGACFKQTVPPPPEKPVVAAPPHPFNPPNYTARKYPVASSIYPDSSSLDVTSSDPARSTQFLAGCQKHTASTYRNLLSRHPFESDSRSVLNADRNATTGGENTNAANGDANGKARETKTGLDRTARFYEFYDDLLPSKPLSFQFCPVEKREYVNSQDKNYKGMHANDTQARASPTKSKGKKKNAFQDDDWLWDELYPD